MEEKIYKIYQHIGNYSTGRRRCFFVSIILIFLLLIPISIHFKVNIPRDTLYWVFSSIVQALLAFVALFGVMAIFKLQSIHINEERLIEGLNKGNSALAILGGDLSATSTQELLENIKKIIGEDDKSAISGSNYKKLKGARELIEAYAREKVFIREFMLKFIIYTSSVVVLALIFLATSYILYQYNMGLPAVFLIIILTIYSLFLAIKGTAEALF